MKPKRLITLLALCCLMAGTALAQEEERGQLWELQVLNVPPDKAMKFEESAKKVVKLAAENNVGSAYPWHFWSQGFDYIVASPIENFASFDDPMAWMRQFGEEGAKKLQGIFKEMDKEVGLTSDSREIIEQVPGWSHEPMDQMQPSYGTIYTFRVKPGHGEAFGELAEEFVKAWKDMSYPYAIRGYRTWFGDVDKTEFVVFHDGLDKYMGDKNPMAVAERAGHGEHYQMLFGKLTTHIDDMEVSHMMYHPDMSYTGPPAGSE